MRKTAICMPKRGPGWFEYEIVTAGVKDSRVCNAIRNTPRHEFLPTTLRRYAYLDMALPIGDGQTISSPFTVAYMTEQLHPDPADKVLEIGTGSGYQAAVLGGLVAEVYSIEIVEPLGKRAAKTLHRLGYTNVFTKIGDGYQGWAEHAPYDKIIVTCSPESVPKPLVQQLKEGGRLVIPLGQRYQQTLILFTKVKGALKPEPLQPTFFVPMVGRAEDERETPAEPAEPVLVNGDFSRVLGDQPIGWYYVRQGKVEAAGPKPGDACLTFRNETPGRSAQALQAVGIDGPADPRDRAVASRPRTPRAARLLARAVSGPHDRLLQRQPADGAQTDDRPLERQLRLGRAAHTGQGPDGRAPGQRGSRTLGWDRADFHQRRRAYGGRCQAGGPRRAAVKRPRVTGPSPGAARIAVCAAGEPIGPARGIAPCSRSISPSRSRISTLPRQPSKR